MQSSATEFATETDKGLAQWVNPRYKLIVFLGPSGIGKNTFAREFLQRDARFRRVVSVTTRLARKDDAIGEYEYVDVPEFQRRKEQELFAWVVEPDKKLGGNWYGTLKSSLSEAIQGEWPLVMDVEPKSVAPLLAAAGEENVCLIFLTAPQKEIEERLYERDAKSGLGEAYFKGRLETFAWQQEAIEAAERPVGDPERRPYRFVENPRGGFEQAFERALAILTKPDSEQ